MKYAEAQKLANDIREFADFIEQRGAVLPYASISVEARCYLTENDYSRDENDNWTSTVNEDKTKAKLAQFLEAVGSCDKEYADDRLKIVKKFGKAEVVGTVDRTLTCRKKVVGTRVVEAYFASERIEEVIEWECDDAPSLLALVNN